MVNKAWLCIYTRPVIIMYNVRNKFLGHEDKNKTIKNEYWVKSKCATTENTQENSILEIINQVIANLYVRLT